MQLPITPEDNLRLVASANRPARMLVVWIGSDGKAYPTFPKERKGDWSWHGEWKGNLRDELVLPDHFPDVPSPLYAFGDAGVETFVLVLADEATPPVKLQPHFDFPKLPKPVRHPAANAVREWVLGEEPKPAVTAPPAPATAGLRRPPDELFEELSPLDQLHAGLENQLQGQCHFACAVSVPSAGGPDLRKGTL